MKKWQKAVDVAPFSAIFIIVLRLLTREISNLALQTMGKVPDVSRNSARWCEWWVRAGIVCVVVVVEVVALAWFLHQCCTRACTLVRFSIPNMSQKVATGWPNARNILRLTMLRQVGHTLQMLSQKCCDMLR